MAQRNAGGRDVPHVRFVVAALAFSILGGFSLAITMPVEAMFGLGGRSWVSHAQMHGHLQLVGFVAILIVGVTYHLLPAFAGRMLARDRLMTPSLFLIAGGVLGRAVGQPLAVLTPFAVLATVGAAAQLLGALCFLVIVVATLRSRLGRVEDVTAPFFIAGAVWFTVQAALATWWVAEASWAGAPTLPAERDSALVALLLQGFTLLFILGVGSRSFPVFFAARRFTFREVAVPFALWQAGLLAFAATGLGAGLPVVAAFALASTGIGASWIAARTGWWRPPSRMRPASRPFALPLQMALAWLTFAGFLGVLLAVQAVMGQASPPATRIDAIRHILGVGVVLTTVVAMAQLVLPEFASERFDGKQGAWRGIALGVLLGVATVLRSGSRWWADILDPFVVQLSMATAGVIAMAVMVTFAWLYVRGLRNHRALLARLAEMSRRPNRPTSGDDDAPRTRTPGAERG